MINFGNQFWQSILATLAINFGNLGNWPRKMAIAILPKAIAKIAREPRPPRNNSYMDVVQDT